MAGASTYPTSLDNDVNLFRLLAGDMAIIDHHNNDVDAIESMQLAMGVADCTLGGRIAERFSAPFLQQANIASTAGRNPRYPFGAPATNDLYGVVGALPAGWVSAAGQVLDWMVDAPWLRISQPCDSNPRALNGLLGAGPSTCIIARIRPRFVVGGTSQVQVGFIQTGQSSLTGLLYGAGQGVDTVLNGVPSPAFNWTDGAMAASYWVWLQVFYNGVDYVTSMSIDGMLWTPMGTIAGVGAPLVPQVVLSMTGGGPDSGAWLDYVAQGVVQIGA